MAGLPVPFDRLLEPDLEPGPRLEAEILLGPLRVEKTPRLPIGPVRIRGERFFETSEARNELRKILDRDLNAGAEVQGSSPS